jgi:signal peptidase I
MIETTDETPDGSGPAPADDSETSVSRKKKRSLTKEFAIMAVCAIVLAIVIKTFLVQAFWIPSASMYPTLERGDRVLVNRLPYHPHVGDVIVFKNPQVPDETANSAVGR